jgi:hypothetical protein
MKLDLLHLTRLITRFLQKGAVLVFPINLVHFQRNAGHGTAVALAALCVGILPIMWLPLSKKMAAMVGCWWQPTTIV